MNYLLAASLPLLILAFGTAASIATTKTLQDWAAVTLEVRPGMGDPTAVVPTPATYTRR
jgi:hypothetical protein